MQKHHFFSKKRFVCVTSDTKVPSINLILVDWKCSNLPPPYHFLYLQLFNIESSPSFHSLFKPAFLYLSSSPSTKVSGKQY